ncbi:MAG: NAD(P)H-dependent oxidoreductase subunit E, partial [bacterium]
GETTQDLQHSLESVACFGSCALAPVVVLDDKVYGRMTQRKTERLIEGKR